MIDFGLILARFAQYAATTTLAGASLFPLYAYARTEPESLGHWRRRLLLWSALAAVLSGLFWFLFAAASMSDNASNLVDFENLWAVEDTSFGIVSTARMLLAVAITVASAVRLSSSASVSHNLTSSILAAVLLASLAGIGHTQAEEGWAGVVHIASDAAHLLAAGAWLGGLIPLAYILVRHGKTSYEAGLIDQVLLRFSGMGYLAVATLVGTGLINSWFLVGSVHGFLATPYGQTLLAKLGLFVGMLALAVANRFWLVPALSRIRPGSSESESSLWRRRLRNHVVGEQLLGMMLLFVVSVLGTMQPAIGQ
ncbi:copper homeostasis membrane protein CopD [Bradyrhizobium sp. BTAi1]|uniref:copper homeostasis membrane protein CopD n=1 Tax=Bradyrhizobium sp. (strain BTAi1 / ATCC BAA-1182) TaxID=288000 RepID=UPI0001519B64|nr:copper homeostasis membrane protein CopD [Bradyrhizobium sp. BTAi1]ABQ39790.1 Copper resistance protein D [Bradyrhizobium sp. BTAi1]